MARTVETHYDNLRVLRDAPVDVIKASYRLLAQRYHPDRNPEPDAMLKMQLINKAWDVLSDPERRAKHDSWIENQERRAAVRPAPAAAPEPDNWLVKHAIRVAAMAAVALAVLFGLAYLMNRSAPEDEDLAATVAEQPAPAERLPHGYLTSDNWDMSKGPVSFEIDNSAGGKDAEVRMYRNGREAERMFVHGGRRFVLENMVFGTYTIKYRIVADGKARVFQARQVFPLIQTPDEARDKRYNKFNKIRVTIFNLADSHADATEVSPDQF